MFNAVYQILQGSARGEGAGLASRLRGFLQTVGLGSTGVALRRLDGSVCSNARKREAFLGGAGLHPMPSKIKATLICIKGKLQKKAVLWEMKNPALRSFCSDVARQRLGLDPTEGLFLVSVDGASRRGEFGNTVFMLDAVQHEWRNEDGEESDSGLKGCIISKGRSVVAGANTVEATADDVEYQVKTEMLVLNLRVATREAETACAHTYAEWG
ncbi:uncharacterized protein EMH_0023420 [Eimeria mitis]|uniref:Uncharacterized protein n=1 Tax=Eimeria mitis TaxID=44415 RepID=U6KHT0_9EIME|nr:uncharacterized protein EMH_0023420 [Eimeria mitis]CDJ35023.1 hypothetical protein, conserved [Eimeria mitis]